MMHKNMRELDGMRIMAPADGPFDAGPNTRRRTLIAASETGGRWALGEVIAEADEGVATHLHPAEPEAIVILEGEVELHGREGVIRIGAGDVVFMLPWLRSPSVRSGRVSGSGSRGARIHTSCAVVATPTFVRALAEDVADDRLVLGGPLPVRSSLWRARRPLGAQEQHRRPTRADWADDQGLDRCGGTSNTSAVCVALAQATHSRCGGVLAFAKRQEGAIR